MSYDHVLLYHITHFDNLSMIIDSNAIFCDSHMSTLQKPFTSIAYTTLRGVRRSKSVPCFDNKFLAGLY
ncbi:DUF4433 domain-containing protein [bacterium]|nr:DUF4433 domain-containing protein [bacterium]